MHGSLGGPGASVGRGSSAAGVPSQNSGTTGVPSSLGLCGLRLSAFMAFKIKTKTFKNKYSFENKVINPLCVNITF